MGPTGGTLRELMTDIEIARGALHQQRSRKPPDRLEVGGARSRLVDALRAYQDALTAEGTPTPYKLRDELRLLESLGAEGLRG